MSKKGHLSLQLPKKMELLSSILKGDFLRLSTSGTKLSQHTFFEQTFMNEQKVFLPQVFIFD